MIRYGEEHARGDKVIYVRKQGILLRSLIWGILVPEILMLFIVYRVFTRVGTFASACLFAAIGDSQPQHSRYRHGQVGEGAKRGNSIEMNRTLGEVQRRRF